MSSSGLLDERFGERGDTLEEREDDGRESVVVVLRAFKADRSSFDLSTTSHSRRSNPLIPPSSLSPASQPPTPTPPTPPKPTPVMCMPKLEYFTSKSGKSKGSKGFGKSGKGSGKSGKGSGKSGKGSSGSGGSWSNGSGDGHWDHGYGYSSKDGEYRNLNGVRSQEQGSLRRRKEQ